MRGPEAAGDAAGAAELARLSTELRIARREGAAARAVVARLEAEVAAASERADRVERDLGRLAGLLADQLDGSTRQTFGARAWRRARRELSAAGPPAARRLGRVVADAPGTSNDIARRARDTGRVAASVLVRQASADRRARSVAARLPPAQRRRLVALALRWRSQPPASRPRRGAAARGEHPGLRVAVGGGRAAALLDRSVTVWTGPPGPPPIPAPPGTGAGPPGTPLGSEAVDPSERVDLVVVDPAVGPPPWYAAAIARGATEVVLTDADPVGFCVPGGLTPAGSAPRPPGGFLVLPSQPGGSVDLAAPPGFEVRAVDAEDVPSPEDAPAAFAALVQGHLAVLDAPGAHHDVLARARRLVAVAAAGVPVIATGTDDLRTVLPGRVVDALAAADPRRVIDPVRQEALARAQCGVVHDELSSLAVWNEVLGRAGRAPLPTPSLTVTIATRRPGLVERWSSQLAAQDHPPFEVVAALHGDGFDDHALGPARELLGDRLVVVPVAAHLPLGEVLAAALGASSGDLVAKWDDDDLYARGHLRELARAHRYSGAQLVGKAADFAYLRAAGVTVRRWGDVAEGSSATVAGPTLLVARRDLVALGGWPRATGRVDSLLIDAVLAAGGTTYRTTGRGFVMVRDTAGAHRHTWGVSDHEMLTRAVEHRRGLAAEWAGLDHDPADLARWA